MSADPRYDRLKVGGFYWVMPTLDVDGAEWENGVQPARFAGRSENGTLWWHLLNAEGIRDDGATGFPMRWVGDEVLPGWQPMGAAPKDGTVVDVWAKGERTPDAYWSTGPFALGSGGSEDGEWTVDGQGGECWPVFGVTHWMARPGPPSA